MAVPNMAFAYIGFMDLLEDRNYTWLDGSPVNYLNWCAGKVMKPNVIIELGSPSGTHNYACAVMRVNEGGCWTNVVCDQQFKPLCGQGPISEQTCAAAGAGNGKANKTYKIKVIKVVRINGPAIMNSASG